MAPPVNDDFANAIALSGNDSDTGTTVDATLEDAGSEDYIDGNTVYYKWTASDGQMKGLRVKVSCPGSSMEPWVSVSRDVATLDQWFDTAWLYEDGFGIDPTVAQVFVPSVPAGTTVDILIDTANGSPDTFTIETTEYAVNASGAAPSVVGTAYSDEVVPTPPTDYKTLSGFPTPHTLFWPGMEKSDSDFDYVSGSSSLSASKACDNPGAGASDGDILLAIVFTNIIEGDGITTDDGQTWEIAGGDEPFAYSQRFLWRFIADAASEPASITFTWAPGVFETEVDVVDVVLVAITPGAAWDHFYDWEVSSANRGPREIFTDGTGDGDGDEFDHTDIVSGNYTRTAVLYDPAFPSDEPGFFGLEFRIWTWADIIQWTNTETRANPDPIFGEPQPGGSFPGLDGYYTDMSIAADGTDISRPDDQRGWRAGGSGASVFFEFYDIQNGLYRVAYIEDVPSGEIRDHSECVLTSVVRDAGGGAASWTGPVDGDGDANDSQTTSGGGSRLNMLFFGVPLTSAYWGVLVAPE